MYQSCPLHLSRPKEIIHSVTFSFSPQNKEAKTYYMYLAMSTILTRFNKVTKHLRTRVQDALAANLFLPNLKSKLSILRVILITRGGGIGLAKESLTEKCALHFVKQGAQEKLICK